MRDSRGNHRRLVPCTGQARDVRLYRVRADRSTTELRVAYTEEDPLRPDDRVSRRRRVVIAVQTYIIVMDGIAALELLALTAGLCGTAWRAPSKPFRAVTVGGAALCLVLALSSVYHVLLLLIRKELVTSHGLLGGLAVTQATLAVVVGGWAIVLALRYWMQLGRSQSMVETLTDQIPTDARARQARLSPREQEILQLIRSGTLTDSDISRTLHIAPSTAATHIQRILRKTGLHNRRDLMLLDPAPGESPG
jgi:DNA-binding CsgD family transcriptional regulator